MNRLLFVVFLLLAVSGTRAQQLYIEEYTPASGLLDNRVLNMFQDNRGLVYFLTWEGVSIFDGQQFRNITMHKGQPLGLVYDMVQWEKDTCYLFTFQRGVYKLAGTTLIEDTLFNSITEIFRVLKTGPKKWIVLSNTGIYKWQGAGTRPVPFQPSGMAMKDVDAAVMKHPYLLFSHKQGTSITLVNPETETVTSVVNTRGAVFASGQPQTTVFLSLNGQWQQLNNEALFRGVVQAEPLSFAQQLPVGFQVLNIFVTGEKTWLRGKNNGWLLLNTVTGKQELYPVTGSINPEASVVFADKEQNAWFCTFYKTVQKCTYTRLTPYMANIRSLHNNEQEQVIAESGNTFFALLNGKKVPLETQPKNSGNTFHWQGRLWSFTSATSITSTRGEVVHLPEIPGKTGFTPGHLVSFDKENRLLVPGISLYIIEKNLRVHRAALPAYTDNITLDDQNRYWAFSRTGTINCFRLENDSLVEQNKWANAEWLNPRYSLHWNADTFCIGNRYQGVIWVKLANGKAVETGRINTGNGLSNNFILSLLKTKRRELYVATGTGFDEILFHNRDTLVQNLAAANNLFLSFIRVVQNEQGNVLVTSADNILYRVEQSRASGNNFIPAAWLSEITVNGQLTEEYRNRFTYGLNNFRFVVTAPCFTNAGSIRYEFLLTSGSSAWQQQSANNFYNINNLSPGNYTLTVTVKYPGKIYPDKKITWSFTITPPFWKRWWFITLVVCTAVAGIWGLVRNYYMRRLRIQQAESAKQQAVEKERNRISRDMHDDLGSGLTKIAILSEVAKKRLGDPEKAREQMEKISVSSRELVDNLQDIIWVLNPRNDTLESLAAYTREYALKYFEPLEVKVNFQYPDTFSALKISEEKRRNVFLTIKESLHNIAKHAWCNQVNIGIEETANRFRVTITDDGRGFDPEKVRLFANGIKNMHNRIEQAGGTYTIHSAPGKGAQTIIDMPV
ncbi:MAG: hypothetical protein JNM68_16800 [Dinghuibacter sp.]|nr:hypothetical protein [Dinghuibacter sp.]